MGMDKATVKMDMVMGTGMVTETIAMMILIKKVPKI
jgi:hypothetical protein